MNRQDIVDAYAAYGQIHDRPGHVARIRKNPALRDLCSGSLANGTDSSYDTLRGLEDSALAAYFGLVDKLHGRDVANAELLSYARVGWPDGLTVYVTNSDDDPFRVNFHAQEDFANDWADAHGALDGGTWEDAGDGFIYDTGQWHPKLFEDLAKEGYDLDFSDWSDPEPEDHETARHIQACDECQDHWDFDKARDHMKEPLVELAREVVEARKLERIRPCDLHDAYDDSQLRLGF